MKAWLCRLTCGHTACALRRERHSVGEFFYCHACTRYERIVSAEALR
jgi:hypothetical protein